MLTLQQRVVDYLNSTLQTSCSTMEIELKDQKITVMMEINKFLLGQVTWFHVREIIAENPLCTFAWTSWINQSRVKYFIDTIQKENTKAQTEASIYNTYQSLKQQVEKNIDGTVLPGYQRKTNILTLTENIINFIRKNDNQKNVKTVIENASRLFKTQLRAEDTQIQNYFDLLCNTIIEYKTEKPDPAICSKSWF